MMLMLFSSYSTVICKPMARSLRRSCSELVESTPSLCSVQIANKMLYLMFGYPKLLVVAVLDKVTFCWLTWLCRLSRNP